MANLNKEKQIAFAAVVTILVIGIISILEVDKKNITGMAMVKLVEYTGNPVVMILVAIGLIFTIALVYSYIFMKGC